MDQLLTAREAAAWLRLHVKSLYRLAATGRIDHVRDGRRILFERSKVRERIERGRVMSPFEFMQQPLISVGEFDKRFLGGQRSAVSKAQRRWNYKGLGVVYVREGKWGQRWLIDYRDHRGKRVRQVVRHAQGREEAVAALLEKLSNEQAGRSNIRKKITLAALVEKYLTVHSRPNNRSWRDDQYRLNIFSTFIGPSRRVEDIAPLDIEEFKAAKLQEGLRKSTINRYLAVTKSMFYFAAENGLHSDKNPVKSKGMMFSEKDNFRQRILSETEEEKLLNAAPNFLKSILVCALNTGMRRSEILNLKWSQVDLEAREIRLDGEGTKSGKGRTIDINSLLFAELGGLRQAGWPGPYVFQDSKGRVLFGRLRKAFRTACQAAGVAGLRLHDCRHSFASKLIRLGVDVIRVRDILGHSDLRMTERYTHSFKEDRKKAVELLCQGQQEEPESPASLAQKWHKLETGEDARPLSRCFSIN